MLSELSAKSTATFQVTENARRNIGGRCEKVLSRSGAIHISPTLFSEEPSGNIASIIWRASSSPANLTTPAQGIWDEATVYIRTVYAAPAPIVEVPMQVVGVR